MSYLKLALLVLIFAATLYLIRGNRVIGSKLTENRRNLKAISAQLHQTEDSLQLLNLLALPDLGGNKSWKYILSLTSFPARFASLPELIPSLKNQTLPPAEIHLNIAKSEIGQLTQSVRNHLEVAGIKIFEVSDIGPGKKLIPTLNRTDFPVIVIDDDLIIDPDLTLKIMIQHNLYPNSVIASRAHHVTIEKNGNIQTFAQWEKQWSQSNGPEAEMFATSGAGTLFTKELLHPEALDEDLYAELSFHTDDLWWYFQARRIGVNVRRVPGVRPLNFIPDTQEQGLWRTGNQERNETNLIRLLDKYGKPF
jgi:hypothetical protein